MNKKITLIYGMAIILILAIQISIFFVSNKTPKADVATSFPAISTELLMRGLNIKYYAINIEEEGKQKDKGVFFEVLDGEKVIKSTPILAFKHSNPDKLIYIFMQSDDDFYKFTLVNGGNGRFWKEKRLNIGAIIISYCFKESAELLKFREVFYHETHIKENSLNPDRVIKYRFVVKQDTSP